MRVLFFGTTRGEACSLHYFTALVRLGHDVLPFDPGYFTTGGPLERLLVRVRRAPSPDRVRAANDRLIALCRENRFDAVFVVAENYLGRDTIEAVRHASPHPPLFLYHSHDNNYAPGILKPPDFLSALAAYDFAFTTKSQNVERYRRDGCREAHFVPSAYEPSVHCPVPEAYRRHPRRDVTFVGTFDGSRPPLLEAAGWDHLHVWGSGWKRWSGYAGHRERITPHPIYYFELADVLSGSRVSLGLLREEAEDLHTQRTFELPACGTLQVAPRNDEILSFFEEGKEIVCFGSPEELRDKVRHYLAHETARARLAKAGLERCRRGRHTYVDRVETMLRLAFGRKDISRGLAPPRSPDGQRAKASATRAR